MIDGLYQDIRYAIRSLASRPLVTAVAVLSLALGIGVNTAIFSAFERLMLRRLPVPSPEQIVNVVSPGPRPGSSSTGDSGGSDAIFSYPLYRDLERIENSGLMLAAHRDFGANLAYRGQTSEAEGVLVSGSYFGTLGVTPALGRLIGPEDDRTPGAHPLAVLSHSYWTTRFGGDVSILGDRVIVNGAALTIVGVAPDGFVGNTSLDRPDLFVPISMAALAFREPDWSGLEARNNHWVYVFGRLERGLTRPQAESRINVPFTAIIKDIEFPAQRRGLGTRGREEFLQRRILLEDGSRGRDTNRDEASTVLLLTFAITGFVLAIACANVANLLLVRVSDRSTEMALRLSIGASTGRLVRLVLVEAGVLGLLGGAGALLVARMTLNGLLGIMPAEDARMLDFTINTTVLFFTLAVGLGTSLLFGLFPAVHGMRAASSSGLQTQSARVSGSRSAQRFRASLATTQIALATALLGMAGLFVVSLFNLSRAELGIRREGLVTFRLSPYLNGYSPDQASAFFDRVSGELRGVPGVVGVTTTTVPLLANSNWNNNITVEGFNAPPEVDTHVSVLRTGEDYYRTVGVPILAGREFTTADVNGAPKVAVVNEAFARKFNLGAQVLGKRLTMGASDKPVFDIEIVGLVRDAKYSQVREPAPPQLALPYRQGSTGTLTFYARTNADSRPLLGAIPPLVARLDANLPITHLRTMDDQIWDNTTAERVLGTLSSSFAGLAILLAASGLYAVLAYGVARRIREIGIRIALGAQQWDVRWLVLSQVTRMTIVGGLAGVALALGLGRLAEATLFGVGGSATAIVSGSALLVVVVALAAAALPAQRASSINPVEALRRE